MSEVSIEALHTEHPDPLWPNDGTAHFDYDEVERRLANDSTVSPRMGKK